METETEYSLGDIVYFIISKPCKEEYRGVKNEIASGTIRGFHFTWLTQDDYKVECLIKIDGDSSFCNKLETELFSSREKAEIYLLKTE